MCMMIMTKHMIMYNPAMNGTSLPATAPTRLTLPRRTKTAHDDQDSGHKILIKAERGNKVAAYSIGLNHSAGADTGQCSKNGEQHSKPCPLWTKSVLDEVHSSAYSCRQEFFHENGQRGALQKIWSSSNKGSNPHPKECPWAANSYSCSHTKQCYPYQCQQQ